MKDAVECVTYGSSTSIKSEAEAQWIQECVDFDEILTFERKSELKTADEGTNVASVDVLRKILRTLERDKAKDDHELV